MYEWVQKKRCRVCTDLRGFQAFDKGADSCKKCNTMWMLALHEDGVYTAKECTNCGEEKNSATDFYISPTFSQLHECDECRSKKRMYMKRKSYKVRCVKSFTMDNKKLCSKCDEVKPVNEFYKGRQTKCISCSRDTPYGEKVIRNKDRIPKPQVELKDGKMQCKVCEEYKELTDFYKNKKARVTHHRKSTCKKCESAVRYEKPKRMGNRAFIEKFNREAWVC